MRNIFWITVVLFSLPFSRLYSFKIWCFKIDRCTKGEWAELYQEIISSQILKKYLGVK